MMTVQSATHQRVLNNTINIDEAKNLRQLKLHALKVNLFN